MDTTARRAFMGAGLAAVLTASTGREAQAAPGWTARILRARYLEPGDMVVAHDGRTLRIASRRSVGARVKLTYTDPVNGRAKRLGSAAGVRARRPFLVLARGVCPAAVRLAVPKTAVPPQDSSPARLDYDVREYGDFGPNATWEQNRDALQSANNAAASSGGGRVVVPPGATYVVKGVRQDSHVHIDWSGSTLRHPDGETVDIIRSRTRVTSGSITARSRTLTVADPSGIEPGCIIGIRGAAPISTLQNTTLATAISSSATSIQLADSTGLHSDGYLRVGSEIISYTGITGATLAGVRRGVYGTRAASHTAGAVIGLAMRLVTTVAKVDGARITLDDSPGPAADLGVTNAAVSIGAIDLGVTGRIEGNRVTGGSTSSVHGVRYDLTRFWFANLTADRAEAALFASVAWDGTYDITAIDCSVPEGGKGSCVWLFQQCHRNSGNLRAHGDLWAGRLPRQPHHPCDRMGRQLRRQHWLRHRPSRPTRSVDH